MLEFRDRHFVD